MKSTNNNSYNKSNIRKYRWVLLLGLFIFLLNAPTSSLAQQGSISIGDTVEITSGQGLRLRNEPGLNTTVIVTLPFGTQMQVVSGPRTNIDGLTWWELEGAPGQGWAAENYLKTVGEIPEASSSNDLSSCEPPYPAIHYCLPKGNDPHVILIDLNNPHVRIETVMANDAKSVNTSNREIVKSMGDRYKVKGAVVVINADYFGGGHGPEGFTVVNGERLDGFAKGDDDEGAVYRSSIAFSKSELDGGNSPITVNIQHFPEDQFTLDANQMFNAVGGGPQIVFNGTWDWTRGRSQNRDESYRSCKSEVVDNDVINRECFQKTGDWDSASKPWTVVGKTTDGHLVILLTTYSNVQSALETNKVQAAIKLDGGGSSQLWYNGKSIMPSVPGDARPIADGLAVFYKNDYQIIDGPPQWPVAVSGEKLDLQFTLKNTGADTWTQKDYTISLIKNPWDDTSLKIKLPYDVKPGEQITLNWQSDPIDKSWGIYNLDFQLMDHENEFPNEPISTKIIVIPQDLAEKKQELERKIQEWKDKGTKDIEKEITKWINRQINGFWKSLFKDCNLSLIALIIAALILYRRSH